ncbi:pentatricopeptide repeat-containing protein chloroplastic-like [Dorcoceras hygrometricum]|uniref:Pentatricopeptide repeat-containing protein chloroplastic-like n=1 Tax=Dorcoceras hygrometricum TaxID=472368 RepID=A0A2Z7B902_9LAMI|nr:pentatricopeptide repeat-containing protein chloroplastic-like [Dorcoceras hygrometricum]
MFCECEQLCVPALINSVLVCARAGISFDKRLRYVLLPKPFLFIRTQILRLPLIYAAVWSKVGGAEFVSSRSGGSELVRVEESNLICRLVPFCSLGRRVEGVRRSCSVCLFSRIPSSSSSVLLSAWVIDSFLFYGSLELILASGGSSGNPAGPSVASAVPFRCHREEVGVEPLDGQLRSLEPRRAMRMFSIVCLYIIALDKYNFRRLLRSKEELESAVMTSALLLEESGISDGDVSFISRQQAVISNDDVSNISRQQDGSAAVTSAESVDGSAMMMSAVMSSKSAVGQKQYQQLIREVQEMERRRLTLNSESDVARRKYETASYC